MRQFLDAAWKKKPHTFYILILAQNWKFYRQSMGRSRNRKKKDLKLVVAQNGKFVQEELLNPSIDRANHKLPEHTHRHSQKHPQIQNLKQTQEHPDVQAQNPMQEKLNEQTQQQSLEQTQEQGNEQTQKQSTEPTQQQQSRYQRQLQEPTQEQTQGQKNTEEQTNEPDEKLIQTQKQDQEKTQEITQNLNQEEAHNKPILENVNVLHDTKDMTSVTFQNTSCCPHKESESAEHVIKDIALSAVQLTANSTDPESMKVPANKKIFDIF